MQMTENELAWYLVRTKVRQEKVARDNLQRQSYQSYLPMALVNRFSGDTRREFLEPLFPGYLFVGADPGVTNLSPIRSTTGVIDIVRFGDVIRPVSSGIVSTLKELENESGCHVIGRPDLKRGDRIRITSGPLAGAEGIFETERGTDRIMVLIEVLGNGRLVQIAKNAVSDPLAKN